MVDPNSTDTLHPGVVTTENLREKLSKQLKIDLDENEAMHIFRNEDDDNTDSSDTTTTTTTPINFAEIDEVKIQAMIDDFIPTTDKCPIKINRLGDYLAIIGLKGGYTVPLRFVVRQRAA
jgi:murein tripeptide amidase MpaA